MLFEILIAVGLVCATLGLFWTLSWASAMKAGHQLERLGKRYQLELTQPAPKWLGFLRQEPYLYGQYRGREVSISVPGHGRQNTRQIESVLKIELRDRRLSAQFMPRGFMTGVHQRLNKGWRDWQTGDAAFDQAIASSSDAGQLLEPLMTAQRRDWVRELMKEGKGTLYIGGGTLAYAEMGLISEVTRRKRFERALEFLCDLAEVVESDKSE